VRASAYVEKTAVRASLLVILAAIAALGFGFGPSLWRARELRSWSETTCTVTEARKAGRRDSEGDWHYQLAVDYTYRVGRRGLAGHTDDLLDGGTYDERRVDRRIAALRANPELPCFVDPDDAARTVLSRRSPRWLWFALLPVAAVLGALGVLLIAVEHRKHRLAARRRLWPRPAGDRGSHRLRRTEGSHLPELLLSIATVVAAVALIRGLPLTGWSVLWPPGIFVWLALAGGIGFSIHRTLALGAGVEVETDDATIPVGGTVDVRWRLRGLTPGARRVCFALVGREVATLTHAGDEPVEGVFGFEDRELAAVTLSRQARSGTVSLAVPSGLMHSFVSPHHAIAWTLRIHLDVRWWPDEEAEVEIRLAAPAEPT
jgi:hypothetical protein